MRVVGPSVLAATLVVTGGVRAQVEMGPELHVNTTTAGLKTSSAVAVRPDGGFVVVWDSDQGYSYPEVPNTSSFHDVFLRRFTPADEPLGPETQVNVHTITSQQRPAVASRCDGGFVVAWQSGCLYGGDGGCSPDGDHTAIAARVFEADGTAGPELLVNAFTPGRQYRPTVATSASDDGFVVAWESYALDDPTPDRDPWGVFARTFDAAGSPVSGELQVPEATSGIQASAVAAGDALGRFVVVWSEVEGAPGAAQRSRILARRIDGDGTPLTDAIVVGESAGWLPRDAAVAVGPDGSFVVVWESHATDDVVARRFGSDGLPRGDEFPVNTHTTGEQHDPAVAMDAAGNFVVVWSHQYSPGGLREPRGVFGQAFAPDGARRGGEFAVTLATSGVQLGADVAANAAGDFVVSWSHYAGFQCESSGDAHCAECGEEPCGIRARRLRVASCRAHSECDGGCLLGEAECLAGGCVTPPGCPRIVVADATPAGDAAALETTITIPAEVPGRGPVAAKITARIVGGDARGRCRASRLVGRLRARLAPGSGTTLPLRLDRQGGRCLANAPGGDLPVLVRVQVRRGHTRLADLAAERTWTR